MDLVAPKSYALATVWPVIFGISPLPAHRQSTVRCDIHRAIPACYSSDSDGAMQPDHGGVLPTRLGAVIVEKIRSVAPSLSSVK